MQITQTSRRRPSRVGAWLAGAMLFAFATAVPVQARPVQVLGESLMQVEGHMEWAALNAKWPKNRDAWLQSVSDADSPSGIAKAIVAFESNLTWEALKPSWKENRANWLAAARTAKTKEQVAAALMGLESQTKWEAYKKTWKADRPDWLARLKEMAE